MSVGCSVIVEGNAGSYPLSTFHRSEPIFNLWTTHRWFCFKPLTEPTRRPLSPGPLIKSEGSNTNGYP